VSVELPDDPSELASPVLELSASVVLPELVPSLLPSLLPSVVVPVVDAVVPELSVVGSDALLGPPLSGSTDVEGSPVPLSDGPVLVSAETAGSSPVQPLMGPPIDTMLDTTTIAARTFMLCHSMSSRRRPAWRCNVVAATGLRGAPGIDREDEVAPYYREVGQRRVVQKICDHLARAGCRSFGFAKVEENPDVWALSVRPCDFDRAREIAAPNVGEPSRR
jgi:hypothetical protein